MSFKDISKSAQDIRANNYGLAQRRMEQLQAEAPYSVDSYLNMSTISSLQGNIADAVASIKKALEMDPFDFRPYYNLFVISWRSNQHNLAFANLKKCLSILYTLKVNGSIYENQMQDLHRAIALWQANTAAYALKIIKLISQDKLGQANSVVGQAQQKCIMKHHIYALGCVVDGKMNREVQRQQNARAYHAHLLRPVQIDDDDDQNKSALTREQITYLIEEFNQTSGSFQLGQCRRYASHPKIMFVSSQRKTTINIQALIANLGGYELSCIKEQLADEQANNEEIMTKQKPQIEQEQAEQNIVKESKPNENENENVKQQQNEQPEQFKIPQQQDIPIPVATQFISSGQKIKVSLSQQLINQVVTNQLHQKTQAQKPEQAEEVLNIQNANQKKQEQQKLEHEKNEEYNNQQKEAKQEIFEEEGDEGGKEINQQKKKQAQSEQRTGQPYNNKQQHYENPAVQKDERGLNKNIVSIEDELRQVNNQKQELLYPVTHSNFQIKLIMADLQISQELIGKMDPYVYYEYGQQKHKTTIAKKQGTRPRWQNQVKIFSLERNPTMMKVSVYDRQIFKWDDLVGTGEFEIIKCGIHTISIFLKGKQSGQVVVYISKVL